MFKSLLRRKRSMILSWFVSYILILLLTLLFNLYAYTQIEDNMLHQIDVSNMELLQNRKQSIDNLQVIMHNLAAQLAHDATVQELIYQKELTEDYKYELLSVRNKIESWRYSDVEIDDIYIYFRSTDYIVGTRTNTQSEAYFRAYYPDKEMSYDTFLEHLNRKSQGTFVQMPDRGQPPEKGMLLYFMSVFGVDYNKPLATVVLEMGPEKLMGNIRQENAGRAFCILDGEGKIVLSDGDDAGLREAGPLTGALREPGGPEMTRDAVFLHTGSGQNDWTYVYVADKRQYLSVLNRMRLMVILFMLLWLAVGTALAYWFAKRNHKPLKRLVSRLEQNADTPIDASSSNEYQYIDEMVTRILKEKKKADSRSAVQDAVLRDAVLLKLMKQNHEMDISAAEFLKSVGIVFRYSHFSLILFYFEDLEEMFFEKGQSDSIENYKLAKLIVTNVLGDMFPEDCVSVFCDLGGILGCVINTSRDSGDALAAALDTAQKFIAKNFNIEFIAGISDAHPNLTGLPFCYQEAMECMEYRFLNNSDIIRYCEIQERSRDTYYFPMEKEFQMINSLKSGDEETGLAILDEIFSHNLDQPRISLQTARCLMYDIIGAVMKALNDISDADESGFLDSVEIFGRIDKCTTVLSMKREMIAVFQEICRNTANDRGGKIGQTVDKVKEFIQAYYDDPNLNGAAIAERFHLNQSYLSNMFKKQAGQGMLEYIATIRVSKAMDLLVSTEDTLEKIAEAVGYINVRTFSRTFLKYVGISPGKYRVSQNPFDGEEER